MKCAIIIIRKEVMKSPSVWREWIEMIPPRSETGTLQSLPPCGGSGLKCYEEVHGLDTAMSPSVWREWIEMKASRSLTCPLTVSLRVEGVD